MMSWLHIKSVASDLPWRRRGRCSCCRRGRESSWSAPRSALSGPPCDVCSPVGPFSPQPDFPRVGASCLQVYYRSSYLLQGNDAFYSRPYCWGCTTLQTIPWPTAHVWVDQSESSRHFTLPGNSNFRANPSCEFPYTRLQVDVWGGEGRQVHWLRASG